jgi:hypothetical protein
VRLIGFPPLVFFEPLEKWTQNGIVPYPLIPPAAGFLLTELAFFLQELLLDVPLHPHTVKILLRSHRLFAPGC